MDDRLLCPGRPVWTSPQPEEKNPHDFARKVDRKGAGVPRGGGDYWTKG
jgi:hypothetical protein